MRYLVRNLLLHLRDSEDKYCRLAFQLEKGYSISLSTVSLLLSKVCYKIPMYNKSQCKNKTYKRKNFEIAN